MTGLDPVTSARRIAEEVLFPAANEVDAADSVPKAHLDLLAGAGLYGLVGPVEFGGLGADFEVLCTVAEVLAGGCLATTFVWIQHQGVVFAVSHAPEHLKQAVLGALCRGEQRSGIALGGTRPERLLQANQVDGGWLLNGTSPWLTGWGLIDVVHCAARTSDDRLVWGLVDATSSKTLRVERHRLAAVDASVNTTVHFRNHFLSGERVTRVIPYEVWKQQDAETLRLNGSLSLGVADRCSRLLGDGSFSGAIDEVRASLDRADATTMPAARASAAELAIRAAAAVMVHLGSSSIVLGHDGQRLMREAAFLLVFGTRPAIKIELLARLRP